MNKTLNREERKDIYGWMQKLFSQDLPVIPLWYQKNIVIYSNRIQNVRLRPDGSFEWMMDVTKDQIKN
ncbi:MAG: hypothetical protein IPJ69_11495 [Deltaproteobacteria bacterium]|nr:MAG: hypothetical protein IPJ69_11495 [Deltaproteobacteria bacterium]